MSIKISSVITMAASMAIAAPAIWDGSADISWYESSAQAYNLTTAEQLAGLAQLVNQGTSSFEGKTITLGADIFLNDTAGADAGTWASVPHKEWTPIGTSSRPFKGEFDGIAGKKNRKIYGLYVSDATKDYVGLFGYTSNVKISNLDVLVGRITAKNNAGALIGYAMGGSVTNVHSEIRVTGNNHVGGLVGYFTGTLSTSSVKENIVGQDSVGGLIGHTTGSVSGTAKSSSYFVGNVIGRMYVGGLVGSGSNISKSYVEGTVKGDSSYVGGIVGYASGSIDSVYHVGGDVRGLRYVAGLAGYVKGNVANSYSEGNVTATAYYVGGVVGYVVGTIDSVHHADGDVTGLGYVGGVAGYASGSIDSAYHVGGDVTGFRHYIGGLVGFGTAISNSFAEGVVKGDSNYVGGVAGYASKNIDFSYHRGAYVSGYSYIGGLVGKIDSTVTKSYSEGDVLAVGNNAGGLIGLSYYFYTGSVAKTVNVSLNSFAIGQVKGNNNVGGLVGLDSVFRSGSTTVYRRIEGSYSKGDIDGNMYVGGIVGKFNSTSNTNALEVINSSYHSDGSVFGRSNYIGGIVGATRGVISSSQHFGGDVSGSSYVGGLAGSIDSTIANSYSNGNVTGTGNYVGGLIGLSFYRYEGTSSTSMSALENTFYTGNVKGNNFVGGLVGLDSVYRAKSNTYTVTRNIKKSHSQGNVEGYIYVGGVIGKSNHGASYSNYNINISGSIASSYHSGGFVIGKMDYVGGVAGYVYHSIDSCYHDGGDVNGRGYVGGLVGYGSFISRSYAEGSVKGDLDYVGGVAGCVTASIDSVNHVGAVLGRNNVGGVIGLSLRRVSSSIGKDSTWIKNAYSIGNVEGNNSVGGLIGNDSLHRVLTIGKSNSSYGSIVRHASGLSSSGKIKGNNFVGGLVGKQSVGSDSSNKYVGSANFGILLSSHNEGSVSADSNYVGGIVGFSEGSVDSVYHDGGDVCGLSYVGGLIGYSLGSVKNAHSDANVTGVERYVGGLVGFEGNSITNSYSKGNVSSDSSFVGGVAGQAYSIDSTYHTEGDVSGDSYVGGLVGYGVSSVNNSYSEGDVIGTENYVGGLAGFIRSISNSHSEGNVVGSLDYVGGAAGSSSGGIRNSYAVAKYVKGRNHVGGLAGYAGNSIDGSYFEGDSVTGFFQIGGLVGCAKKTVDSSYSTANVKGDDDVGGLVGSAYGDVSYSYALGNVIGDVDHSSAGNDNLGGLIGYQYDGSVSKSMALGSVSGTSKLGGLVGRFDGTKISQSYANGNVTGSYYGDPADEVGNFYIGGLVGYAKGSLDETYASGIVKGIENEPVYTGCVVGYVNGSLSVTKSYYDETKCNLGIDGGEETATVSGSPNKTTTEMQIQETFEDWDFAETWKIQKGAYPFLQIYSNSLTNAVVTTASLEGIKYDGLAKTPLVNSVTLFGETLEYESEYTITYKNNINAGSASINVCGVKPYGGCKVVEFEIAGIAIKPTIAAIEDVTYTGRAQTPEIEVYNSETLLAPTDYVVEYMNNVNAGSATVRVTMKGNYSGSASKTFTIKKATPVISQNPTTSDVILGQTLAASELRSGRANIDGEFVWKEPTIKPTLENDGYAVIFVPADADNYTNSAEIIVPVNVLDLVYVAIHAGDNTIDSTTLVKGTSYTLPNIPDSIGYDFIGLYKGKTLVGKSGDQIDISENTVIEAIYKIQTFVITFMNGSTVLQSNAVNYGTIPEAPFVTTPENTAQYTYSFVGWDKNIVAVTETATYTAIIDSTVNKYEVAFNDYDGTALMDSVYEYGTAAANIVRPVTPTRISTAQYTYTFKDWSPAVTDVTEDIVYTATFDSTVNTYQVAFVNAYDETQSVEMDVEYGETPVYEGTPTRNATAQYVYTFSGWSPEVESVTGNATYTALFDSTLQNYVISFVNGREELQSENLAYGVSPEYKGTAPIKTATAQYTYTFKGWSPTIASVTGAATYEAVFDSVVNKYEITFKNGSSVLRSDSVAYGMLPTEPSISLPQNNVQYTYSIKWDKTIAKVTGDAVYTATIDSAIRNYIITFAASSETLQSSIVAYGATPSYKGETPTKKATIQYTYTFKGWTPSITSVSGDATYKAVFDSTVKKYTVSFVNGDKILQTNSVAYGETPVYTGKIPTKTSSKFYSYEFVGWQPKLAPVKNDVNYVAIFDSVAITGIADAHVINLKMSVCVVSRNIQISAAPVGSAYAILDLQGRVLKKGRVESANFNIAMPQAGNYMIRIGDHTQRISIK